MEWQDFILSYNLPFFTSFDYSQVIWPDYLD